MKAAELRNKSIDELNNTLLETQKEHFNLRMQKGLQQLTQTHTLRQKRKEIARLKTLLIEKGNENNE